MHFYGMRGRPIIWLRIPQEYVRSRGNAAVNNIGFYFEITYPDLKGAFSEGNEGLFGCTGYCHGRIMIELMNRSNVAPNAGATLALMMRFKHCTIDHSLESASFSKVERCDGPLNFPQVREDFYIEESADKQVSGYVICNPLTPVPMCQEWMRLPKHGDVEVHYWFSMHDLPRWSALHRSVANLIDGFVVKTIPAQS